MIDQVGGIVPGGEPIGPKGKVPGADGAGFKDMLNGFMKDVNDLQMTADESIKKLATGEIKDVHQAMIKSAEADVSFKLMMEIRNKLMDAYKEVMKTQI